MTSHWAFDTEDDSKGHVYIINFFDGETHTTFHVDELKKEKRWKKKNAKQLTKELRKRAIEFLLNLDSTDLTFWAVNLQYDLVNLFGDHLEVLEIGYVGSRVISARVPETKIKFHDTLNHWKISVKGMGERIGLKKLDSGDSFNNPDYCRRDTEIAWRFVERMRFTYEKIDCKLKATIGSTSLRYFEESFFHRFTDRIFKESELEFMKEGYYGGRTEVFRTTPVTGKIFYFDFNSLYPSVMCNEFPVLTKDGHGFTRSPDFSRDGFVDADVLSPRGILPYLPFRDPDRGRLLFPLGRFRGVYTYFEMRRALELGYKIEKIHRAFEFTAGKSKPFTDFVNFVYQKRLEAKRAGDELMSDAYKLLANNLYGKFGQGRDFTKLVPHHGKFKPGDIVLGPLVVRESRGPYPVHSNFVWSAYTTAYGRDKLYRAAVQVEQKGGELLYMDTDSLLFENEDPVFRDSDALGDLKLEGVFKYAHFKLPKLYRLEADEKTAAEYLKKGKKSTFTKAKGIPQNQAEAFFDTGKANFKRPYKLRESLRRNLNAKEKRIIPNFWDDIEKQTRQVYDKRIVNSDGSTTPLIIGG